MATTSVAITNCTDTPSWNNGNGYGCKLYGEQWCQNRKARPGQGHKLGKKFNHPEKNCCVCGKDHG